MHVKYTRWPLEGSLTSQNISGSELKACENYRRDVFFIIIYLLTTNINNEQYVCYNIY